MRSLTVTKCHGTGNDFVLLDAREEPLAAYANVARELCHRRFSIGADGLLVLERSVDPEASGRMRIFNADGTEAQMCGNGIRCVARYLHDEDTSRTSFDIRTAAGLMRAKMVDWQGELGVSVSMGTPDLSAGGRKVLDRVLGLLHVEEVNMGNPHAVVFASGDLTSFDLRRLVNAVTDEHPDRTNVEVAAIGSEEIAMRVHERGVGETWACGTGAGAVAVAAIKAGGARSPLTVRSRGGAVGISWAGPGAQVYLTGDAHLVFRTSVRLALATPVGS